ncbi:DUF4350 domain-containing protein [Halioxenophilus aromaticivorans]|uniref:DUF4350 domain-containing protein n=1 Tax=Halioxenophilus aromaticivorans TaxID=1306992 RepID=A0AAV3U3H2_9ALTE
MSNQKILLVVAFFVLLPATLFLTLFESYEDTKSLGWSQQAHTNPYLAAQMYLESTGRSASSSYSLQDVLPFADQDTIIIGEEARVIASSHQQALQQWVENGGHLIIASQLNDDQDSHMVLPWLDIELYATECGCSVYGYYEDELDWIDDSLDQETTGEETSTALDNEPDQDPDHRQDQEFEQKQEQKVPEAPLEQSQREDDKPPVPEAKDEAEDEAEDSAQEYLAELDETLVTTLQFGDEDIEYTILFNPAFGLYHAYMDEAEDDGSVLNPFYWRGSDWAAHFVQFTVGDGLVTVMSDSEIWKNTSVEEQDHAYLLTALTDEEGQVLFVIGSDMPSLLELIWRYAKEVVISGIVCLVAWLVYRGRRFAPALPVASLERRSLAEHLQAVAAFHWRARDPQTLIESLQSEIDQLANRNIAGYSQLQLQQQHQALANFSHLPLAQLASAMGAEHEHSEHRFTETVKTLQVLRRHLLTPAS